MTEYERIASILLDAATFGDGEAARKWNICKRTVRNYRSRMRKDPDLAAVCLEATQAAEAELGGLRVRFLRKALEEMERRLGKPETSIEGIAECVRIVGEQYQVAEAMGVGSDDRDQAAAEAEGRGEGAGTAH